ncbi:MAG: T9SS type A sorting domain-containing protein, partial [Bacteroidia bacterium]|nr:T9SS type A sorting domain-containing protein [Bacteroidia bacterium]
IGSCNLPSTKIVNFNGFLYEFSIACRNNDELVLTVISETLGLENIEDNSAHVSLFPNPANDVMSFSDTSINEVTVFDINGRKVLYSQSNSISVNSLSKGVYIVKGITADNISITRKLIKN